MKKISREPNTKCEYCGKVFFRMPFQKRQAKRYFCSVSCRGKANIKNKTPNTVCAFCDKPIFKWNYQLRDFPISFCNNQCKGKWMSQNLTNENSTNWKGGIYNNRVQILAHTSYRTWRANILKDTVCILCGNNEKLELHHIESRKDNPDKIRDESNVVPMCAKCHDIFHSNSSKGEELRENLNSILEHGNPQPSRSNVISMVERKVQRLTGEDITADKPDTRIAPERDEIVRAYLKG